MTDAERRLWYLLRSRRFSGVKFRRQVPIGPYIVDFLAYDARLIVEADGDQHAESRHDAVRDAWLRAQGFRILRFSNREVLRATRSVLAEIATLLDMASSKPWASGRTNDEGGAMSTWRRRATELRKADR